VCKCKILINIYFKSLFVRNFLFNSRYDFFNVRINYSTSCSPSTSKSLPVSKVFNKLNEKDYISSYRDLLKNKAGIYSFINTVNSKQYIGSAKDFYLRLIEDISNKNSKSSLEKKQDGLNKFNFCIYEYFTYDNKILSNKAFTDLETS